VSPASGSGRAAAPAEHPLSGPDVTAAERSRGARLFCRAALARTYVRVVGSFREPSWMVSDAVLPNLDRARVARHVQHERFGPIEAQHVESLERNRGVQRDGQT